MQESYFEKLNNAAPYFVLICFDRLKSVYISLLQLKYDIEFFSACTESTFKTPLFCVRSLSKLSVFDFQEFILCVVPFIFHTSLDIAILALLYAVLHALLEDFLCKYLYSTASSPLQVFLLHACQFCNSAIKCSPSAIVKSHLVWVQGQDFKYDTTEVHFHFFFNNCVQMHLLICSFQICSQSCLSYLDHTPCSKYIYNAFVSLIFQKFSITEDLQSDFNKWARKVLTSSLKVSLPVSRVHLSQDFKLKVLCVPL